MSFEPPSGSAPAAETVPPPAEGESAPGHASRAPEESPSEIASEAILRFAELGEYLSSYIRSQIDRAKLSLRDLIWWALLVVLLTILAAGILVTAVVFFFYGAAEGLTFVFGGRVWAGYLTTGGGVLLILTFGLKWGRSLSRRKAFKKRARDYEEELKRQSQAFGHNALERATD